MLPSNEGGALIPSGGRDNKSLTIASDRGLIPKFVLQQQHRIGGAFQKPEREGDLRLAKIMTSVVALYEATFE